MTSGSRESWHPMMVPALLSFLLHAVIAAAMLLQATTPTRPPKPAPAEPIDIVQATTIDNAVVEQEMQRLQKLETDKIQRRKDLEKKADDAEKRRQLAERQRKEEERKLAEKTKKEEARLSELKKRQQATEQKRRQEEVRQKQAEEKRKRAEEAKKKAETEKRLAEKKRKQAEEAKKKAETEKQLAVEAKKKAETEKQLAIEAKKQAEEEKKKADDARRRLEAEKEKQEARETQRRDNQLMGQLSNAMQRHIQRNFNVSGMEPGSSCKLEVRLAPGGAVLAVTVTQSSGDELFDSRAITAVRKSSPLPVPNDTATFKRLRLDVLSFTFDPW